MTTYIDLVLFYSLLIVLFLSFVGPWISFRIDLLRHKLFHIRNDLFWYVDKHPDILHSTEAYCMTRTTINGMIRFADELTLGQLLIDYWILTRNGVIGNDYENEFESALHKIDEKHRLKIDLALNQMHQAVIAHVIATSPLLCLVFLPTKLISKFFPDKSSSIIRTIATKFSQYTALLDAVANTFAGTKVTPKFSL